MVFCPSALPDTEPDWPGKHGDDVAGLIDFSCAGRLARKAIFDGGGARGFLEDGAGISVSRICVSLIRSKIFVKPS